MPPAASTPEIAPATAVIALTMKGLSGSPTQSTTDKRQQCQANWCQKRAPRADTDAKGGIIAAKQDITPLSQK